MANVYQSCKGCSGLFDINALNTKGYCQSCQPKKQKVPWYVYTEGPGDGILCGCTALLLLVLGLVVTVILFPFGALLGLLYHMGTSEKKSAPENEDQSNSE